MSLQQFPENRSALCVWPGPIGCHLIGCHLIGCHARVHIYSSHSTATTRPVVVHVDITGSGPFPTFSHAFMSSKQHIPTQHPHIHSIPTQLPITQPCKQWCQAQTLPHSAWKHRLHACISVITRGHPHMASSSLQAVMSRHKHSAALLAACMCNTCRRAATRHRGKCEEKNRSDRAACTIEYHSLPGSAAGSKEHKRQPWDETACARPSYAIAAQRCNKQHHLAEAHRLAWLHNRQTPA